MIKNIKNKKFILLYKNIFLFFLIILFCFLHWQLSLSIGNLFVTILKLAILVIFYIIIFLPIYKNLIKILKISRVKFSIQIIPIITFSIALIIGIEQSIPTNKTYKESIDIQTKQTTIAQFGVDLAEQINENKLTEEQAREQINFLDTESDKNIAKNSLDYYLQTEDKDKSIYMAIKTVPVKYLEWTCNEFGCSFADNNYIWTISSNNRIFSVIIIFASMVLLLLVTNKEIFKPVLKKNTP